MTAQDQGRHVWSVVEALASLGLRHAVLSPGYRNVPLLRAFEEHPGLTTEVVVDERTAGFVALGHARASGQPVVLVCTSGSAPAHYAAAVVEAARVGLPLWVLTADRPQELQRVGAPQTVPQQRMFGEHAVWFDELTVQSGIDVDVPTGASWVAHRIAMAWAASTGADGGPVHINLPLRKPLDLVPRTEMPAPLRVYRGPPALTRAAGGELQQLVRRSQRPLLVAGPELTAAKPDEQRSWDVLSRARGWPLVTDILSPWRGAEGSIQAGDVIARAGVAELRPDLVIWSGGLPTSRPLLELIASASHVVQVSPSGRVTDPMYAVTDLVVADEGEVVDCLLRDGPDDAADAWLARWQTAEASVWAAPPGSHDDLAWDGDAWAVAFSCWIGRRFHIGSSLPIRDTDAAVRLRSGQRAWGNRGANGIDGSVATAWGEAAGGGEPLLAVIGDVALTHDLGSLAQLPKDVPLAVAVLNNGGGQIFSELPGLRETVGFERLLATPGTIDIAAVARALDLQAHTVDDAPALRRALGSVWEAGGRGLIEIRLAADEARAARSAFRQQAVARVRASLGNGGA